jgi:drug/metabolite transporter (DMT)-like permease
VAACRRWPAPSRPLALAQQATALQHTSATKAGFIVQLTAVLVPLLAAAAGTPVPRRVWGAAGLALAGTTAIAVDRTAVSAAGVVAGAGGVSHLASLPVSLWAHCTP